MMFLFPIYFLCLLLPLAVQGGLSSPFSRIRETLFRPTAPASPVETEDVLPTMFPITVVVRALSGAEVRVEMSSRHTVSELKKAICTAAGHADSENIRLLAANHVHGRPNPTGHSSSSRREGELLEWQKLEDLVTPGPRPRDEPGTVTLTVSKIYVSPLEGFKRSLFPWDVEATWSALMDPDELDARGGEDRTTDWAETSKWAIDRLLLSADDGDAYVKDAFQRLARKDEPRPQIVRGPQMQAALWSELQILARVGLALIDVQLQGNGESSSLEDVLESSSVGDRKSIVRFLYSLATNVTNPFAKPDATFAERHPRQKELLLRTLHKRLDVEDDPSLRLVMAKTLGELEPSNGTSVKVVSDVLRGESTEHVQQFLSRRGDRTGDTLFENSIRALVELANRGHSDSVTEALKELAKSKNETSPHLDRARNIYIVDTLLEWVNARGPLSPRQSHLSLVAQTLLKNLWETFKLTGLSYDDFRKEDWPLFHYEYRRPQPVDEMPAGARGRGSCPLVPDGKQDPGTGLG